MFGAKTREIARLKLQVAGLREQLTSSRRLCRTAMGNQERIAKKYGAAHDENQLLRKQLADAQKRVGVDQAVEIERLTRDLDAERRQREHLQKRLDEALGLDDPEIEAGASWQARRVDKAGGAKC